jgi:general secretion pathway protein K
MPRSTDPSRDAESGFILVVILAVALLLALVAAAFSHAVRGHLRIVAALSASARAEAVADAGVTLALVDLSAARQDPSRQTRFARDGTPTACRLEADAWVSIAIADEAGKVNLNTSNDLLIAAFLRGLAATPEDADTAIDRVLDFRDGDSNVRAEGAEAPEYLAQGRPKGMPKNAPFDAVEELDQVLGLEPSVLAAARRWATVHTTLSGVDPEVADPALTATLAAGYGDGMAAIISREFQSTSEPASLPPEISARSEQSSFTVRAVGHAAPEGRFVREVVIEVPPGGLDFVMRRWHQSGDPDPAGQTPTTALPPC